MPKKVEITGKPERIEDCDCMIRFFELLNKKQIVRRLEHANYQTFMSRVKLHTDLTNTVEQKAFAQEMTEMLDELFYEIGVAIGRIKKDPHKKYKYLDVEDPSEREKDELEL